METIRIKDKQFKTFITEEQILKEVARVGEDCRPYEACKRTL